MSESSLDMSSRGARNVPLSHHEPSILWAVDSMSLQFYGPSILRACVLQPQPQCDGRDREADHRGRGGRGPPGALDALQACLVRVDEV